MRQALKYSFASRTVNTYVCQSNPNELSHPVVSVNQVVEGLHVSQPAANAAMNNLLAAGIVELRTANRKWGRVFNATAVLDRLNRS